MIPLGEYPVYYRGVLMRVRGQAHAEGWGIVTYPGCRCEMELIAPSVEFNRKPVCAYRTKMKIYARSPFTRSYREHQAPLRQIVADLVPGSPHRFLMVTL